MRINKYLAECNISSRRKVEEFIKNGKIMVNGNVVTDLSTQINESDVVKFNGVVVKPTLNKIYLLLNKPIGYITTVKDEQGRHTVLDLIVKMPDRIYPVGRLDCNTEGMLILTNDGDFANLLIHPRNEINKVYRVQLNRVPSIEELNKIKSGVKLEDYVTKPAQISNQKKLEGGRYQLDITIHEGKNREVRKMFEAVGLKVKYLARIKIGSLPIGNLPLGKYKTLSKTELDLLLKNK